MRALTTALALALAVALVACGGAQEPKPKAKAPRPRAAAVQPGAVQLGKASWYGGKWHGGPTASGERYDKRSLTAAHRTLPMNTRVRVTNTRNGRSVVLRINNRGPYTKGRIIDVSERAAEQLGMVKAGVVPVRVEVIGR